MGDTQQPHPADTGAAGAEAAAALAEIQRRQEHVIKATLVPLWYWWAMAVAIVALGAARDSRDLAVRAITIPLAVLAMVALTGMMTIPALRRRVGVQDAAQSDARAVAAVIGMILLVNGVIISIAASLAAAHAQYPVTIGSAAGAAALMIVGPLVNRYARRRMLSRIREQMSVAPRAGGSLS